MSYFNTKAGSVEEAVKGLSKDLNDSAYQDMFKKELEKSGKGIASMSPQEKKDFFNKIDKMYKAKNEDATDKDIDVFHKKLDKLVHKSFGHSSDEKKDTKEAVDKEDKKENIDEKASMAKMYTKKASNGDVEVFYRGRTKYGNDKQIGYYHKQGSKFVAYHDNSDDKDDFTQSDTYNDERSAQMTILQTAAKERVITEADNPYAVGMAAAMKQTGDKPPLKKSTITKAHDIAKSIEKDEKNEDLDKLKEDVAKLFETHTFRTKPMNDKQKNAGGEKEVINPIKKEEKKETVKMSEETAKNFDLYRAVHSVWTNAAEDLEEMKKNSKYMKADDVSTKEPEEQNKNESEKEKGKTMIGSQKTKVETEPSVDYTK